jgi:hypothetical protein
MQNNDEKITYGGCWNDGDREAYEKWFMETQNDLVYKLLVPELASILPLELKLRILVCKHRKINHLSLAQISNKFRLKNKEAARSICRTC